MQAQQEKVEAEARQLEQERLTRESLIQKAEEERRKRAIQMEERAKDEPMQLDEPESESEQERPEEPTPVEATELTPTHKVPNEQTETAETVVQTQAVETTESKPNDNELDMESVEKNEVSTTQVFGTSLADLAAQRRAVEDNARAEASAALKRRPSRLKPVVTQPEPSSNPTSSTGNDSEVDQKKTNNENRRSKKTIRHEKSEKNEKQLTQRGKRKRHIKRQEKEVQVQREAKHGFEKPTAPVIHEIDIPSSIVISDLAQKLAIRATDIIKELMKMGYMMTINQSLDQDTAILVTEELGHIGKAINDESDESLLDALLENHESNEFAARPPVVTIMGHVDHGKTSLLDHLRHSRITAGEAGGITQHIGAYHVDTPQGFVTFLDTPGHSAFTRMRARGTEITDIVILIVAADDGVMPQTKEAIQHVKAANVPMVVAINKMDKPDADPDRVLNELSQVDVLTEAWGGDVPVVKISAKDGTGTDELLETLLLLAELQELKTPMNVPARGTVIEASIERGRGSVATILVRDGVLRQGDLLLCGIEYGRARALFDENGKPVSEAGPSKPVSVLGLSSAPSAGDEAFVVKDEKKVKEIIEMRKQRIRDTRFAEQQSKKLDNLFDQMQSNDKSIVAIIVKADVQGSVEALTSELTGLSTEEIEVRVISSGVGGMSESDIDLAIASKATVIAFNVRADARARRLAQDNGVEIRYYSIIYDVINDVKDAMSGLLSPEQREQFIGLAEVKDVFRASNFGQVAGCLVTEGVVRRGNPIRVLRNNVVIYEGELESLRRHKDDVNEVIVGTECGIAVKNYNDVRAGDSIEVFEKIEVARTL